MNIREMIFLSYQSILEGKSKSVLTIIATSVGVGTIVFLMMFGYGMEKMIKDQISSPEALKIITVNTNGTKNTTITDENLKDMSLISSVKNVEPGYVVPATVTLGDKSANTGLEMYSDQYLSLSEIKDAELKNITNLPANSAAISLGLAKALGKNAQNILNASAEIEIIDTKTDISQAESTKNTQKVMIQYLIDDETPFIIGSDMLTGGTGQTAIYNVAKVKVAKESDINAVRENISQLGLNTTYLGDTLSNISSTFSIFRYLLALLGLSITIVAVLGAFNTLTISLMRRTQEIGILKIHGAGKADIALLFVSESLLITILGSFLGITSGIASALIANYAFNYFAGSNGGHSVQLFYFPVSLGILLASGTLFVGLIVGIYPAIRATKIKILDAIKYE